MRSTKKPTKPALFFLLTLFACLSLAASAQRPEGGPPTQRAALPESTIVHRNLAYLTNGY